MTPTLALPLSGEGNERAEISSPCKGEVGAQRRAGVKWDSEQAKKFNRTKTKTSRARSLRTAMTDAERKLWWHLCNNQMQDLAFRRQHPAGRYVLDFYCAPIGLVIELDGGQHNEAQAMRRDAVRDAWLVSRGLEVLRFWNADVLMNIEAVLETVWHAVERLKGDRVTPTRRFAPTSPLQGEEVSSPSFPPPVRTRVSVEVRQKAKDGGPTA